MDEGEGRQGKVRMALWFLAQAPEWMEVPFTTREIGSWLVSCVGRGSGMGDRIMTTIWDMSNMYEGHLHGNTQEASGKIVLGQKRKFSARYTDLGVITFCVS